MPVSDGVETDYADRERSGPCTTTRLVPAYSIAIAQVSGCLYVLSRCMGIDNGGHPQFWLGTDFTRDQCHGRVVLDINLSVISLDDPSNPDR